MTDSLVCNNSELQLPELITFLFASFSAAEIFITVAVSLEISIQRKGAACYQSSRRRQRQIKSNEKTWYRYREDCDYQRANCFVTVRTELRRIPGISNGYIEKSLQTIKVLSCSLSQFPYFFFSLLVGIFLILFLYISPTGLNSIELPSPHKITDD